MTKVFIGLHVDEKIKAKAAYLASADDRTLSSWVLRLITREIERATQSTFDNEHPSP